MTHSSCGGGTSVSDGTMLVTTTTTKQNCALFQTYLVSGSFNFLRLIFFLFLLLGVPREPTSGHELPGLGSELDQLPA